jgi:glucosamine--fructose-6-phosphate aminotransferase (isomerizing)
LIGGISLPNSQIDLDIGLAEETKNINFITIIGCGTSFNAGYVGKYLLESLLDIPVSVEYASEFRYFGEKKPNQLALVLSQSGEAADTIGAIKKARQSGIKTLLITNVSERRHRDWQITPY